MLDKTILRQTMLQKRQQLTSQERESAATAWTKTALEFLSIQNYQTIAGYMPIRGELNVLPLLEALREAGKTILLPRTPETPAALTFHEYHEEQLESGLYDIQQPTANCTIHTPDIILVPLTAFDEKGNRLGYGGGYYDRTLAEFNGISIGCAYDFQRVDSLLVEAHDKPLDSVIALNR